MVELKNVDVHFKDGGGVDALNGVNLRIEDGEFVFIVGDSGAGKSTLLKLLTREIAPTSGRVFVNGYNLAKIKNKKIPYFRRSIGMIFQDFRLIPDLNVYDNVAFVLRVTNKPKKTIRHRVPYVLNLVKLVERAKAYPDTLSGGEKQRVAIARALVKMPPVLLLDEPLSNLDARLRLQTREEIRRIQRETGITTIFVTHDQEEAMSISDIIIVMKDGRMQQVGRPQEVYDNPVNLFVAKFLGTPPINVFNGYVKNEKLYIGKDELFAVQGVSDREVYVGIRPEGFIPEDSGKLHCKMERIEIMGRDISIVSKNDDSLNTVVRSIITNDRVIDGTREEVAFNLKPSKVLIFDKETEERIRYGEK